MPAIGVYPFSSELLDVLTERYHCLSDRSILSDLLIQPTLDIQQDVAEGLNPFIGRERYRAWLKLVQNHIGPIDLPDWDTVTANGEWPWEIYEMIESGTEPEWDIFFDSKVAIEDAIAELDIDGLDIDGVISAIERTSPPGYFLAVTSYRLGVTYVIHSPQVDLRGPCDWNSREGYHMYENLADGEDLGPLETYVLIDDDWVDWQEQLR